jgi:hypothetical protein
VDKTETVKAFHGYQILRTVEYLPCVISQGNWHFKGDHHPGEVEKVSKASSPFA